MALHFQRASHFANKLKQRLRASDDSPFDNGTLFLLMSVALLLFWQLHINQPWQQLPCFELHTRVVPEAEGGWACVILFVFWKLIKIFYFFFFNHHDGLAYVSCSVQWLLWCNMLPIVKHDLLTWHTARDDSRMRTWAWAHWLVGRWRCQKSHCVWQGHDRHMCDQKHCVGWLWCCFISSHVVVGNSLGHIPNWWIVSKWRRVQQALEKSFIIKKQPQQMESADSISFPN